MCWVSQVHFNRTTNVERQGYFHLAAEKSGMPAEELAPIGYGTYGLDERQECVAAIQTALDVGYRHLDTAQMYHNEEFVGAAIAESDVPREEIFLATKVNTGNLAYDDVLATTEASLEKLGVDTADLLYVHWPSRTYDAEETLAAFDELHEAGRIRHIGLSNFTPDLLAEAREILDAPVFAHQAELHPLLQQPDLRAEAIEHDEYLVAYSPLARNEVAEVPELVEIGEKHDASPAQVALAWLSTLENVLAIPKAASEAHIRDNFAAQSITLDADDLAIIESLDRGYRIADPDSAPWN